MSVCPLPVLSVGLPWHLCLMDRSAQINQTQATKQTEMLAAQCCGAQPSSAAGTAEGPAVAPAGWKKLESQRQGESRVCKLFLDSKTTKKPVHNCFA